MARFVYSLYNLRGSAINVNRVIRKNGFEHCVKGVFHCAENRDWIHDWNRHGTNTAISM